MNPRLRLLLVTVVGVLAAALVIWLARAARVAPTWSEAVPDAALPAATVQRTPTAPAAAPTPEQPAPPQVALVRPPPDFYDAGLKPVASRPETTGPIDKRDNPGPRAKQQLEMIHYAFETLDDDIRACLEQWDAVQPGEATQVMIAFEIDEHGLQKSWLEHDGGIPFGPRTCLSNAVYGLDWSHIVDHPAKLTNRFERGRSDGGG